MKICVAQTRPVTGDIQSNIASHKKLLDLASAHAADMVIFPELSLTGYEPKLAKELATNQDDSRFDDFQKISNTNEITIGVGVPTKNNTGVCISMVVFQPYQARQTYSKGYLHRDEEEFFVSGQNFSRNPVGKSRDASVIPANAGISSSRAQNQEIPAQGRNDSTFSDRISSLKIDTVNIALAICYELSVPEHAEQACKSGSKIYIGSVAKFINGIDKALKRLSDIAKKYGMTIFMANCVGQCDGHECAGKSSIWNNKGLLVGQLNDTNEGILIFDTDIQETQVLRKNH